MATVTFLSNFAMQALPTSGTSDHSEASPIQGYHGWTNGSTPDGTLESYVQVYGTFAFEPNPPALEGTISRALIASAGFADSPDLDITGLSHFVTFAQWEGVRTSGDILGFVAFLLNGHDTVVAGPFSDGLEGFAGDDVLVGGGSGDDLSGLNGSDTASYATAPAGLFAGLEEAGFNTGDAAGDSYDSIENLTGSNFNDTLYGSVQANRLSGGAGNDGLVGKGGGDVLNGGAGSDTAFYDTSFAPSLRADLLNPSSNTGHAAGDVYISIENLEGSSFNDTLLGNNAANVIRGSHYPNLASGADKLFGRGGNDTLRGHDGNDTLTGGLGKDNLTGGTGRDFFDFNAIGEAGKGAGRDIITDLSRAADDRIDLSTIDAKTGIGGNQTFKFIGTQAFHDVKGELRCSGGIVQGDVNGDGKADFEIKVNIASLQPGDFFL